MNRLIVAIILTSPAALAASNFDCATPTTHIENVICTNADLTDLNKKISSAYKEAATLGNAAERNDLRLSQQDFLDTLTMSCPVDRKDFRSCLRLQIQDRIFEVENRTKLLAAGDTTILYYGGLRPAYTVRAASGADDLNAIINDFSADISRRGVNGKLIACMLVVKVPLTRIQAGYGGFCTLRDHADHSKNVLVCNDSAVGNFEFINAPPAVTKHDLALFTADHCIGG